MAVDNLSFSVDNLGAFPVPTVDKQPVQRILADVGAGVL
jgi:hypothetical protein